MKLGLRERVIYRGLLPPGLTLFDLKAITDLSRAQPSALTELAAMLEALELPRRVTLKRDAFYAGD